MSARQPPDFQDGPWILQYAADSYWDPQKETIAHIRLVDPISEREQEIREKLEKFWFAKSYRYIYQDGKIGGLVIRPFNQAEVIKSWGLIGDERAWIKAVLTPCGWHILKEGEKWEFGFEVSKDKDRLTKLELYLNGELVSIF